MNISTCVSGCPLHKTHLIKKSLFVRKVNFYFQGFAGSISINLENEY